MKIRIFITAILVGITGLIIAQSSKAERKEARQKIKTYVEKNVIPVIKPLREDFDQKLSASEKVELAEVRSALQEARKAKKEMVRPEKGEKPTEAQREAFHEMRNEHRKLMMRVWTIADNHESELKQIREELKPQMQTWREDMKAMMEASRPDRSERKELDGERSHGKERGERMHHGGRHGKMGHRGKGGLSKLASPTGFLLWDTDKSFAKVEAVDLKAYPNPATTTSMLEFNLTETGPVTVKLINGQGETLKVLKDEVMEAGSHQIQTNISELGKGLYFYQVTTEEGMATQKIWVKEMN